jgi:hypothetical protein
MFFSVFCSRNVRLQSGKRQSASLPRYRTSFQARGHSGGSLPSSFDFYFIFGLIQKNEKPFSKIKLLQ